MSLVSIQYDYNFKSDKNLMNVLYCMVKIPLNYVYEYSIQTL